MSNKELFMVESSSGKALNTKISNTEMDNTEISNAENFIKYMTDAEKLEFCEMKLKNLTIDLFKNKIS